MAISGTAAGIGTLVFIGGQVNPKLALRLEKDLKIKTLAEAKLYSVSNYISVALTEEHISADEYSLILSDFRYFWIILFNLTQYNYTIICERCLWST